MISTFAGLLSTQVWLKLIQRKSKPATWAVCASLFLAQLIGTLFVTPRAPWWVMLGLVTVANLSFSCHDVAALSLLGDIVDYGKLKFNKDRGATYFAVSILIFKIGLGVGSGVALGTAALFGFSAAKFNTSAAVFGLKLGFAVLPACFAFAALLLILRMPINRRRHSIIERRLKLRYARAACRA
jgi:Na+/melibiose symporter-like transporter